MAVAATPGVVRERHGIFVDGSAPVTAKPEAPFGYDFADPKNLSFWWSQGALGMWQVADISLSEGQKYKLYDTPGLAQVKLLADLNGRDPVRIKAWEQANHAIVNFGHLREANTYAWRGDAVSLAAVLDHRFGQMRDQVHSWIATIDADALVFTTHPSTGLKETTDWADDGKPGYWTGEASMPRSAQLESIRRRLPRMRSGSWVAGGRASRPARGRHRSHSRSAAARTPDALRAAGRGPR